MDTLPRHLAVVLRVIVERDSDRGLTFGEITNLTDDTSHNNTDTSGALNSLASRRLIEQRIQTAPAWPSLRAGEVIPLTPGNPERRMYRALPSARSALAESGTA